MNLSEAVKIHRLQWDCVGLTEMYAFLLKSERILMLNNLAKFI